MAHYILTGNTGLEVYKQWILLLGAKETHVSQWSMPAILLFFGPIDLVKTAIAFTRIHQSTYRFEILTLLNKD